MLPLTGPTCESVRTASPDARCSVRYVQTRGKAPSGQTRGVLECSGPTGGFAREFIQVFGAEVPLPLRWMDAQTVEVGLPVDGRFSPPVDKLELVGFQIRFMYRPTSPEEMAGQPCLDPPEGPESLQLLSGNPYGPTNASRWLTFGSAETCVLAGSTSTAPENSGNSIATRFSRTATVRFPYGTDELVLTVSAGPRPLDAFELQLAPSDETLEPTESGRDILFFGAPAARVLEHLVADETVVVTFIDEGVGLKRIELTRENFVEAREAFETCQEALER